MDESKIVAHLQEAFGKEDPEGALIEDMASLLRCKIEKEGWLWFGLSQEDWAKMRGGDTHQQIASPLESKGCGPKVSKQALAEGLPSEAATQFKLGREEETHEPA